MGGGGTADRFARVGVSDAARLARMTHSGYSGTPTAKKLGMKPGDRVALIGCDTDMLELLGDALEELDVRSDLRSKDYAVIVLFCPNARTLRGAFGRARGKLTLSGGLWVAWPKKSSGVETDLSDGAVREYGLAMGMVDNKKSAITDVWSGLRFVVRIKDR